MGFEIYQQLARSNIQIMVSFRDTFSKERINIEDPVLMDEIDDILDKVIAFVKKLTNEEFQDWDFNDQCKMKAIEIFVRPEHAEIGRRVYCRKNYEAITAFISVNVDEFQASINFFEGIL